MAFPFDGLEVEVALRPAAHDCAFDLEHALAAVVALEAHVPEDALTATTLGTDRLGNGIVIGANGLVLTMAYLVTEADEVVLTLADGRRVSAEVRGIDQVTGFGLVQALDPLGVPTLPLGTSRSLTPQSPVIIAGAGGLAHAAAGRVLARMPFAGYWEYLLDEAIMTEPAHPHWSGAALLNPAGEVVGVGSLSLERRSRSGPKPINMFVPAELLPPILDDVASGRPARPPRPWLGVFAQEIEDHVVIVGISPRSPASRAELRTGDVVLAVDGTPVTSLAGFYTRLWSLGPAGVVVPLRLRREDDEFDVEVRSVDRAALLRTLRAA